MKIVLAPDSFKGSLTATQVCAALEAGARRVFPNAHYLSVPLADGGEGTLDALLQSAGGRVKTQRVRGPLGDQVSARWGILPDGQAIIEMAQASGLDLVPPSQRDALKASSFGTGQLIKAALDAGCRDIILGIGGSATTDGGVGALNALGLSARDSRDRVLKGGGAALAQLATLDLKFFDARLSKARFTVLCDVTNPLHGPNGAAHVYAAQKGASPAEIVQLDAALKHYADVMAQLIGKDHRHHAGAGAAGGIGFAMLAFCKAAMCSGIDVVLDKAGFADKLDSADLVLTGEGALDEQTLSGKTIAGACRVARAHRVPIIAFGGAVRLSGAQMDELGLVSAFSLADGPRDLEDCLAQGTTLLSNSVERALRIVKLNLMIRSKAA